MARKIVNINVDTIKSTYASIAAFKQLDAVTLNINICENGVAKNLTGQTIKLYIRREDRSVLEQLDEIEIVDIINGKIEIKLKNNALNCQGNVFCELEFEDLEGTITSSDFIFLVKSKVNHADVIMNTSELSVLKQIETYVIQAKKDLVIFRDSLAGLNDLVENKDYLLRENREARTNINSLDSKNSAATSNISSLDSKNTLATTNISELETNISTATTKNTELTNTIASAETAKTALETAIANGDIEAIKVESKKLTDEVNDCRTDYWGKEHVDTNTRLNSDFQQVVIDNTKGMFLEQKGTGSLTVKNTIEGSIKDLKIIGNTTGGYNSETSTFSPLVSVGEQENGMVVVRTCGKNILSGWKKGRVVETTGAQVETAFSNNLISIEKIDVRNITEQLALTVNMPNIDYLRIAFYETDDTFIRCDFTPQIANVYRSNPVPSNANYCRLSINYKDGLPEILTNEIIKASQLEVDISTEYEPYREDKKDILLPYEGGLKGFNGVCDVVRLSEGKVVKNCFSQDINELSPIYLLSELNSVISFTIKPIHKALQQNGCISNNFKYLSGNEDEEHMRIAGDGNVVVYILKSKLETQDVAGFKKWLQDNLITIIYELATPIIHEVTPQSLSTFKPLTTVNCETEVVAGIEGKFPCEIGGVLTDLQEENAMLRKNQIEMTERFIRKIEDIDHTIARMNNAKN